MKYRGKFISCFSMYTDSNAIPLFCISPFKGEFGKKAKKRYQRFFYDFENSKTIFL